MMNIRDEPATNTTNPAEPIPPMTIASPPEDEVQGEVDILPQASMPQSRSIN